MFAALSVHSAPTLGGPISSITFEISPAMYSPVWESDPEKVENLESLNII